MKKFYSVVIPINPSGQVLMGKRLEDGIWTTPAGGSEGTETPIDCAIRESDEEALLQIVPSQLEFLYEKKTHKGESIFCYLFRCGQSYTTPQYDPDEEVKRWVWIDPINFPKEFFNKKHANRRGTILDALKKFHYIEKTESPHTIYTPYMNKSESRVQLNKNELQENLVTKLQTLILIDKLLCGGNHGNE